MGDGEGGLGAIEIFDFEVAGAERGFEGSEVFKVYVAQDEGSAGGHGNSLFGVVGNSIVRCCGIPGLKGGTWGNQYSWIS